MFCELSHQIVFSSRIVDTLLREVSNHETNLKDLAKVRDDADKCVQKGVTGLHNSFITPMDRNKIFEIFTHLYQTVENIELAGRFLVLNEFPKSPSSASELYQLVGHCIDFCHQLVLDMENLEDSERLQNISADIRANHQAIEFLIQDRLAKLFVSNVDAKNILKEKMLFDTFKAITKSIVWVAHLVEVVVLEHS